MATDLERLIVTLEATTKQYERALAKAQGTTVSAMRKIEREIGASEVRTAGLMAKMGKSMGTAMQASLAQSFRGMGASLVALLGFDVLKRSVEGAIRGVAELGDKAADLGIDPGELQVWNRMIIESGESAEFMARALSSITEQSQDADSKIAKLFSRFNRNLTGNATQDMLTLMNILEKMPTQAEKLAAITDVFGDKLGRKLAETLTQTSNKFFETNARMEKGGEKFSKAQIQHARDIDAAYNDMLDQLNTAWQESVLKRIEGTKREIELIKQAWGGFQSWWQTYVNELSDTWNSGKPNALQQMFGAQTGARNVVRGGTGGGIVLAKGKATESQMNALNDAAADLGVTMEDLATVISYETAGTMSPSKRGLRDTRKGARPGDYFTGLIQFGGAEQREFGASGTQTFEQQMRAVVRYLKARGLQPGSSLADLYSTVLAGEPGTNRSDAFGSVAEHINRMGPHRARVAQWMNYGKTVRPEDQMPMPPGLPKGHVGMPGYQQAPMGKGGAAARDPEADIAYLQKLRKEQLAQITAYDQTETIINSLTDAYAKQQEQLKTSQAAAAEYGEALSSAVGGAVQGFVNDLMNGVEAGEAFSNMLKNLASQLVNMALSNLFSAGGAPGGLFGQLFGGGLTPNQKGGTYKVGGSTGEHPVMLSAQRGETITVTPRRLKPSGAGAGTFAPSTAITVNGNVDEQMFARMNRMIEVNNQRQRQALHRDFGAVQANYQMMRGP